MSFGLLSAHAIFQSTPSARRATQALHTRHPHRCISIHALREESDPLRPTARPTARTISIHALREESDVLGRWWIRSW